MLPAWISAAVVAVSPALLTNGNFEQGIEGWNPRHPWYAQPKDGGLSEITIAAGEGRDGSNALKIAGQGKRGLAMQVMPAYPGQYRVTGWIKSDGLQRGKAGVLAEWIDGKQKWMRGDWAVEISGTQDWQWFEKTLEAPPGTRSVHFDLITTEPNDGTVWFDDIQFERIPTEGSPPQAPALHAATPDGGEGCLTVRWDPATLGEAVVHLLIVCDETQTANLDSVLPAAVADAHSGEATLSSLENGKTYRVAAVAVDADGRRSLLGPSYQATVADRQPPRPGWFEVERTADGKTQWSWSPHVLDDDVRRIHICLPASGGDKPVHLATVDVNELYQTARPLYCTEPWIARQIAMPAEASKLGVRCEDGAGNSSEVAWADVQPARPAVGVLPGELWTAAATEQLSRDAEPPPDGRPAPELLLLRGQAKGFQVVLKPRENLPSVRVAFEPLVHQQSNATIASRWLAYHFVDYVKIENNSRATPREELVWTAPSEYPDQLSDARSRDLPPGQVQPIYIRVTAPRDAEPGLYRGRLHLQCASGSKALDIAVRVAPLALPEKMQLKFVYWFSWDAPCKEFGVAKTSEDGWRALACLARLMRAHHQNAVTVPWSLVRSWRTNDGTLRHDFRDFDRFVETFRSEAEDWLFLISHQGSRTTSDWLCPTMSCHRHHVRRLDTGEAESIDAVELLPAIEQHIGESGLLDRFAVHVADEPIPQNRESYVELAARVRRAAPRLPRIDAIHIPDLDGSLEIFVPQLNYLEKWLLEYRSLQRAGNELWFYVAWVPQGRYPNRMIDSHAVKSRVLHWLNALYDTTGYLHWALNHWHIPLTSLGSPGDQYICWPSERFIADSSLRYEAEREGLEDCQLFFMLRDAIEARGASHDEAQRQIEAMIRPVVRDFQDYSRSWRELEETRKKAVEALPRVLSTTR